MRGYMKSEDAGRGSELCGSFYDHHHDCGISERIVTGLS